MGLDVYLYRCARRAEVKQLEDLWKRHPISRYNRNEGNPPPEDVTADYHAQSDEVEARFQKQIDALGGVQCFDKTPTRCHPDHMFQVGYWRSSYNAGGINHYLADRGVPGLYEIAGPGTDDYEFAPDWEAGLVRATAALAALRDWQARNGGFLVSEIRANRFSPPTITSSGEAMARFIEEREKWTKGDGVPGFDVYNSRDGVFWQNENSRGRIVAAIHGTSVLRYPCVYLIFEARNDDDAQWYEHALECVVETFQYVLSFPPEQRRDFYFHWSS